MRRPTLLCLLHCAPPAKPGLVSDTVLGSVAARHWETPEQGYPSDESGAQSTRFVVTSGHRANALEFSSDAYVISPAQPLIGRSASYLVLIQLSAIVSLSETTYDESP